MFKKATKRFHRPVPLRRCAAALACASFGVLGAQAANLTWDSNLMEPGVQDGNGIWTASTLNFWNGTANATPIRGTDNLVIGDVTGGFTVTIDNGGAMLNYSDNTGQLAPAI